MPSLISLALESLTGMAERVTSVGHGFAAGDIPAGTSLEATINGVIVPLQMDVLATWDDGSVKHAIISFEAPQDIGNTATLDLGVVTAQETPPTNLAALAAAQEYDFSVTIDGEMVDVAALVQDGPVDLWQSGTLVTEGRVTHSFANGLELRADVTVKADGTIDTSITIGNDNIETTSLDALTYAVEIVQNGETVFENSTLTQYHFTVWREAFSTAETPNTVHAVYDMAYLRGTGLLPAVDTSLTLMDGDRYGTILNDPNATYDPLELGGIDNDGGIDEDRGRSGATKNYGLITDDQHSYLVTQSAEARAGMLELTDQYGAFSDFYYNPETGEAYLLEDTEFNSFYTGVRKDVTGTGGVVDLTNDGLALRNKQSHDPSAFYTAYLVTGDRYYADGLASEGASAHLLWKNAAVLTAEGAVDFGDQLRAQAWGLRDLFYAATLAPDDSHAKPVLEARLDAALQDYVDYYIGGETLQNQLGRDLTGAREAAAFSEGPLSGVLQSFNGTALDRPYWQDWFGAVIGQIAMTGNETAKALGEWMANFSAGRFLQDDFDPTNSLYSLTGSANGSSNLTGEITWAALQTLAEENGTNATDGWQIDGFFTASAWGGNAALFSGTRDARYAEALLWMTGAFSENAEERIIESQQTVQLAAPIQFLDFSIAGISDRTVGTDEAETIADGHGNRLIAAGDGDDTVITGDGNHLVEGGDGDDSLTGGAGEDWLFGGSGADRLDGGGGVNVLQGDRHDADFGRYADTFAFNGTLGETEIVDFTAGQDVLELTGFADLRRVEDVLSAFIDTANGALLDQGEAGRVLLRDVAVSALDASDFLVNGPNEGPIASDDDAGTLRQGESTTLAVADLLTNDRDPDGDPFALTALGEAVGGMATLHANGTITFIADADFTGPASFTYTIEDDLGGVGTGIVTLDIEAARPPIPDITNVISRTGWIHGTDQNDHIIPLSNNVRVFGHGGDDLITLGGSSTVAKGGSGNDTIIFEGSRHYAWGNNGEDAFVVKTGSTRIDIVDFSINADSLYFANGVSGIDSLDDIEGAISQAGSHTVIALSEGFVRLRNVDADQLIGSGRLHTYTEARNTSDTLTPPDTVGAVITGMGWLNGTDQNDMIVSGGGNVRLIGGQGDDHMIGEHWGVRMIGGAGDDLLEARAHDGILRGDAGADTFLFRERVDGRIDDFNSVEDTLAIDVEGTGIADYEQLLSMIQDGSNGIDIVSDNGDRLTLTGIDRDTLTDDMILFV